MSEAADLYRALRVGGRPPRPRRLTYRCAGHRCLLLDVVDTPVGVVLHQRRYKYGARENEQRSSVDGRARSTYDGARHWHEQTYYLDESALAHPDDVPPARLGLTCDHVLEYPLAAAELRDDWAAGRAEVRVRADGSRYAVG